MPMFAGYHWPRLLLPKDQSNLPFYCVLQINSETCQFHEFYLTAHCFLCCLMCKQCVSIHKHLCFSIKTFHL